MTEVFHARFRQHAYPVHTHTVWTLLILDNGALQYNLERHRHGCVRSQVVLLPPHIPHDGRTAAPEGFCKRVIYLAEDTFDPSLTGATADNPTMADPLLWDRIGRLHDSLTHPGDAFEAQSRLALIVERLNERLEGRLAVRRDHGRGLAEELRDLLDQHVSMGLPLDEAARVLYANPTHLVRAFTARFSIPPHQYLTGRRVELARQLLLSGMPAGVVAAEVGLYDQSHLARHFKRMLGVSPASYARTSGRADGARKDASRR